MELNNQQEISILTTMTDEEVEEISRRLMEQNKEAYEVLAR